MPEEKYQPDSVGNRNMYQGFRRNRRGPSRQGESAGHSSGHQGFRRNSSGHQGFRRNRSGPSRQGESAGYIIGIFARLINWIISGEVGNSIILDAPTGVGKTTKFPIELANAFPGKKIVVVVPTIFAANTCAKQVATSFEWVSVRTGEETINYSQFPSRIEYQTAGFFNRWILNSSKYPHTVIIDEAHTFSEEYHCTATIAKNLMARGVNIIFASATISPEMIKMRYDIDAELHEIVAERPFNRELITIQSPPVERQLNDWRCVFTQISREVMHTFDPEKVNLVVLPGIQDIRDMMSKIEDEFRDEGKSTPLMKQLCSARDIEYDPCRNPKPAIYFATFGKVNSALTIPGLSRLYVCGITKGPLTDGGIDGMGPLCINKHEHKQIIGRIGRVCDGKAYLFYNPDELPDVPTEPNFPVWRSLYVKNISKLKRKMNDLFTIDFSDDELKRAYYGAIPYEKSLLLETLPKETSSQKGIVFYLNVIFMAAEFLRTKSLCNHKYPRCFFTTNKEYLDFCSNTVEHICNIAYNTLTESELPEIYKNVYDKDCLKMMKKIITKIIEARSITRDIGLPDMHSIVMCLFNCKAFHDNILLVNEDGELQGDRMTYKPDDKSYLSLIDEHDLQISLLQIFYIGKGGHRTDISLLGINLRVSEMFEEAIDKLLEIKKKVVDRAIIRKIGSKTDSRSDSGSDSGSDDWNMGFPSEIKMDTTEQKNCYCGYCDEWDDKICKKVSSCGHVFHEECLSLWVSQEGNCCPICRFKEKVKDIRSEENRGWYVTSRTFMNPW